MLRPQSNGNKASRLEAEETGNDDGAATHTAGLPGKPNMKAAALFALALGLHAPLGFSQGLSPPSLPRAPNSPAMKTLPGHVPAVVARLAAKGNLPDTNRLNLAIGLPLRDGKGLDDYLARALRPGKS